MVEGAVALTLPCAEGRFAVGHQQIRSIIDRRSACTDDLSWRPERASARKTTTVQLDHGAGEPSGCSSGTGCRRRQVRGGAALRRAGRVLTHGDQP